MFEINKKDTIMISAFFSLLVISLFVIKILVVPLLFAFVLVYILNPIYLYFKKYFKFHFLTSIFVLFLFFMVTVLPIFLVSIEMTKEIYLFENEALNSDLDILSSNLYYYIGIDTDLGQRYESLRETINNHIENLVFRVPEFLFNVFLISFFYFYFSKHYNSQRQYLKSIFKKDFTLFDKKIYKLLNGIVYGQIFVRFIQALIGTIGFLILGINGAIFWGPMLFFVAFLPILGTSLIWFPLALFYYFSGDVFLPTSIIILGLIISLIDNLLLPHIVSGKTNMGPVITLISIIGGLSIFGFYGIVLGPLFLGLLVMVTTDIFNEIRKKNPDSRKYIWSEAERKKYKSLRSKEAREEFINKLNLKYASSKEITTI